MIQRSWCTQAALVGLLSITHTTAWGQESQPKVADILADPRTYVNEVVTVEGFATQWVPADKVSTTAFWFLKDDWGGLIKVRTSKEKPTVGKRYRVSGPVGIDPVNQNDVYISEETRDSGSDGTTVKDILADPQTYVDHRVVIRGFVTRWGQADGVYFLRDNSGEAIEARSAKERPIIGQQHEIAGQVRVGQGGVYIEEEGGRPPVLLLVGGIVAALVLLVGLLVWMVRRRDKALAVAEPSAEPAPEPQVIEGRTIKIHAPPPGTLKILPGRLEVTNGDESVREIRFYRVKGQTTPELTFGRIAGAPFTHVELKQMTVSRRQAKVAFLNNQWTLTNYATADSNPTKHNGRELPVDGEVVLSDGDSVEMGEVKFVFRAN